MSSAMRGNLAVDRARETLCREFARMLKSGACTLRTRIVVSSNRPVEAWFYVHRDNGWQKEPGGVTDREHVHALQETLDMLASRGHADEWSAKQQATADHRDTDIQFHRDKLQHRLGAKLESALTGILFRDSHDSKKDVRRSIRIRR